MALFHRQGGGEPLHGIDGGGGEAFQMKAGVGRKGLEVAALSFRIDGVKSEGGLP